MGNTIDSSTLGFDADALSALDRHLRDRVEHRDIPGIVLLIGRHGEIAHEAVIGGDRRCGRRPFPERPIFRIFSMTKPITAIAMAILHDRGLWQPEDPIARHIPEIRELNVARTMDASGRLHLSPASRQPTMHELMTHTAGFSYGQAQAADGNLPRRRDPVDELYRRARLMKARSSTEFLADLAELPLAHEPGSAWRYSVSVDLQGAIVERLSGRSLAQFCREEIFEPLGMHDTAFHLPRRERHRLAAMYVRFARGPRLVRLPVTPFIPDHRKEPDFALGGAGLFSTAQDYARFCRFLLDGGRTDGRPLVTEQTLRHWMTNHLPEEMLEAGFTNGHMRFRTGFGFGYGGVVVHDPVAAGLPVGAGTYFWDGAADTFFWVDPAHDLFVVGMTQLLSYSAPPLQEELQRLVAAAISD